MAESTRLRGAAAEGPADPAKRQTLKKLAALGALALMETVSASSCRPRGPSARRERKVLVLGLDGLDARLLERMMAEGRLPHFQRLQELGAFRRLTSTVPPQSPVAWASFITGQDPGGHGLYDFVQRDPATYEPYLCIARTAPPARTVSVGRWRVPISHGRVELLRRGTAFWDLLAAVGIPCAIYRVPSNFPPRDSGARQLAGLGAPDLRGTYGEYSFFSEEPAAASSAGGGGATYPVQVRAGHVRARLVGPRNTLEEGSPETHVDFEVWVDRAHRTAKIVIQGQQVLLRQGEWSHWVRVSFPLLPGLARAHGICRFYLKQVSPSLKLYVTPINVDPERPALPITAPGSWARELAERYGPYYTQGFPEDVKALRHGVLDEEEYLQQAAQAFAEAKRMYEDALQEFHRGLLCCYFSDMDRIQHMFWRAMDPQHPAYDHEVARRHGQAVQECYQRADALVGQALEVCDRDTTLIVLSDHGFAPYYRNFHLNTWLAERGYLVGARPWRAGDTIFENTDWMSTRAYGLGFNAVYLNLRGREAMGIVDPAERPSLIRQLASELRAVRDPETGARVIDEVYVADEVYRRAIPERAPDLVVGYASGYRCSDASVLGEITETTVSLNRDRWSGDHCVDRKAVPGILLANRPMRSGRPGLEDVAVSVLAEFGVRPEGEMAGNPVW